MGFFIHFLRIGFKDKSLTNPTAPSVNHPYVLLGKLIDLVMLIAFRSNVDITLSLLEGFEVLPRIGVRSVILN